MSADYTRPNVIGYGTRVTRDAAKAAYDIGGEILVVTDTDRGPRIDVTDQMTVNDPTRTPWYELAASVDTWAARYPGQTFYVVVYTVHQDEPDCDGLGCDLGGCVKCQPNPEGTKDCHGCLRQTCPACYGDERDVYTRRLIVTLPNVSGEEADEIATMVQSHLRTPFPGMSTYRHATVTHALGETLPDGVMIRSDQRHVRLWHVFPDRALPGTMSPLEARQIAGALIAHAEAVEAITGQTPGLPE